MSNAGSRSMLRSVCKDVFNIRAKAKLRVNVKFKIYFKVK